jgi:hypothetical protein
MPDQETLERVEEDKREGKAPSTQAGEFIREEMHHIREGMHGARSAKQAIAIGLSKARRAGVDLPQPKPGTVSEKTRRSAASASAAGKRHSKISPRRCQATFQALKKESSAAASPLALSRQAHKAAQKKSSAEKSARAKKAARTRAKSKV